jgi:hypothetical protein
MDDMGSDFDVHAPYDAFGEQLEKRGVTWTQVTREVRLTDSEQASRCRP